MCPTPAFWRAPHKEAVAAHQRAIDDPDVGPQAAVALGRLLQQQGHPAGARAAYQLAIDSGHPDAGPHAALNMGWLLQQQGHPAGARAAYQLAIDSGHPDAGPNAAVDLGRLLEQQGDPTGARAHYQLAIASCHTPRLDRPAPAPPTSWPSAPATPTPDRSSRGDPTGARAAYQLAIDSGHPDAGPHAAVDLGRLLEQQGDPIGARAAYRRAIDCFQDGGPATAFSSDWLCTDSMSWPTDRRLVREKPPLPHLYKTHAIIELGWLVNQWSGKARRETVNVQIPGPRSLFSRLSDSQRGSIVARYIEAIEPEAHAPNDMEMANRLELWGDKDGADSAYQLLIAAGDPSDAPEAAFRLGVLRRWRGDLTGARASFKIAVESGSPRSAPLARIYR